MASCNLAPILGVVVSSTVLPFASLMQFTVYRRSFLYISLFHFCGFIFGATDEAGLRNETKVARAVDYPIPRDVRKLILAGLKLEERCAAHQVPDE